MGRDSAVDNNSTGLDNMNNIKVAPLTTLSPQIDLSVRFRRITPVLSLLQPWYFHQDRVVEMYNMLLGISSEIEKIKLELVDSEFYWESLGEPGKMK